MIEISNISLSYDNNEILKDISYKFREGKIYGLIGKNGAGKSSLLKTISRLNRDSEGEIKLKGVSIKDKDYLELAISFVGDTPVYYQDLTVKEHLLLICSIKKIPRKIAINKINSLLDLLKLDRYSSSFPNSLSRGTLQRLNIALGIRTLQRLNIALGIIRDEDLILMDEPFITLDPVQVSIVEDLILQLKKENRTFLISSHDIDSLRDEDLILMDEPFITLDPVQVSIVEDLILQLKKENRTFLISSHDIDSLKAICDTYLILKDGKLLEYSPNEIDKNNISKLINDSYGD